MLLYFGPEIMAPLATAAAAVAGAILMFWRRVVASLRAGWRSLGRLVGGRPTTFAADEQSPARRRKRRRPTGSSGPA